MRIFLIILGLLTSSFFAKATEIPATDNSASNNIAGVWKLVEYHDFNADGSERDSIGPSARGLFVCLQPRWSHVAAYCTQSTA